jgi:eukaryotic translation initiation factor 2C
MNNRANTRDRGTSGHGRRGYPLAGAGRGRGFGGPAIFAGNVPAQVPDRLSAANLHQLITGFKSLTFKPDRPLRPGYGTVGTPITLRANFFAVKVPQGPIYDYAVEISPKEDVTRVKARIFQLLENSSLCREYLPYIAHDRSQRLVSAHKLPQPLNAKISYYDDDQDGPSHDAKIYTLSINFQRELDPGQLTRYARDRSSSTVCVLISFHLAIWMELRNIVITTRCLLFQP